MPWIESHTAYKGFTAKIRSEVTLKFKGICQGCGKRGVIRKVAGCYFRAYERYIKSWRRKPFAFEIHHIVTVLNGGDHSEQNLTLLCHRCHKSVDRVGRRINALSQR